MAFQYLTNVPLQQARQDYLSKLMENGFRARSETIPVAKAAGRITAGPVYAHICAPHYPASAMDGIALAAACTFGATETTPVTLSPGEFIQVDTGDPIPQGCDAVVMIEDVIWNQDGSVRLYQAAPPWSHIRQVGEDVCAGEMILGSRMPVSPAAIGAMLAAGVMEIQVLAQPVVGIIPTGDEIIAPVLDPHPGQIIEFNSSIFSAMLEEWGARPMVFPIVKDRFQDIVAAVEQALTCCDMVLLNAGSSAGREDYSAGVIQTIGAVLHHGVAMKPGKPAVLGYAGPKPILGVPGYPVSGILVLEQLLKPCIKAWYGLTPPPTGWKQEETVEAILSRQILSGLKYQEFVRVCMGVVNGRMMATPLSRGSGMVSSFMKADGILEIPQGVEGYPAGSTVTIRLMRPREDLEHTLVAVGSHDPLLDEVGDLMHSMDPTLFMRSNHVGSMGGIMAVRRGETHIAGIHLLNEADGTYNTAFVKRYFPQGGVRLVECVGRIQGLMVQTGNPKQIQGIQDLGREDMRYVNRQKGSGTRILTDYLCRCQGIDTAKVYGYDREEMTHTSVAAQIATGTADLGMGIYSAAKLYGLDFLPVCTEQYDLLIPDEAWDTPMVQAMLKILAGEAFKKRILALGGYTLTSPGAVRERF